MPALCQQRDLWTRNTPHPPHEEPGGLSNNSKCMLVRDPGGNNLNAMTTTTTAATTTTTLSPSHRHPHASVTLFTAAIFQFPTSVSQLQACARSGRNAGSILKIKDGSPRNDGDSRSSSTSSGNVPCPADTHHGHGRNRDKTVFTASGVDPVPPIDFVQATRPVPDVTTPCF